VLRGEKTEEFESFHLFQTSIDVTKSGLIAFVTKAGETDAVHLYSIKKNEPVKTFQYDDLINISSPRFSGDEKFIVFKAVDQKGFSDIFLLHLNDDSLKRLTNDYYDDKEPVFSPDNRKIIFSSDRTTGIYEKKYNLFSFNTATNEIAYITYLDADSHQPLLTPDKDKLFFTSDIDGIRNIWAVDIEGEGFSDSLLKITDYVTSVFNPAFTDSSEIIFSGFENFSFNIYKLDKEKTVPDSADYLTMDFRDAVTADKWTPAALSSFTARQELKYEKEYTLDYAQSQVSTDPIFGTRGGAIFSLSDLLGNDNYFFLIYNTADVQSDFLKSFNIAIQRIDLSERANHGYGVFHFSGRRYDIRDSEEFYFERSFGGFFLLHFPISKFQRIETGVTVANSDKQVITGVIERKALLVSNTISYVMDNSLWVSTGPVDGTRARLLLGYTGDVKFSNVNYFTAIADYRQYFRLGLRSAVAFRSALFFNQGKEARRYFMGGSWDLRGWPRWTIRGEKMWLGSLELRFPLIDQIRVGFPFVNLGFFGIRGALFFDAGGAWDDKYRETLGSIGGGFRFNLFGVLALRYDIGKKIENDFGNFQKGLFYQFFFGWDF
jgi:hypothetical protein